MVSAHELMALSTDDTTNIQSESDFHAWWINCVNPQWTPEQLAFTAGGQASNPSLLFIAGYQSAVTRTFAATDNTWRALAISEDRSADKPRPGVSIDASQRVNGFKTWVAASRHVKHIIFTANTDNGAELLHATSDMPGVSLSHKPAAKFLSTMSQGIAEFNDVDRSQLTLLLQESNPAHDWKGVMKQFAKREPLYLFIALCGRLHQHARVDVSEPLTQLLTIANGDFSAPEHKALFADVDTTLNAMFPEMNERTFISGSSTDLSVLSLYSPVIQKRAGRG